ncbi:hypothetical protein CY34DRAFT_798498 [Suillus luteus UH-Slu-Lm8-n1]|uniref:Uncharacterized protein n=1 Tax=Suillus luteus UH-Slu-Lm8-n1 TaxID=930992 RepID=A0A0D0B295_9AGAM|nr:hypothetical protein CY34DRAFT_798498 [Suillus luteus UH-Slu-Lm8-n1]
MAARFEFNPKCSRFLTHAQLVHRMLSTYPAVHEKKAPPFICAPALILPIRSHHQQHPQFLINLTFMFKLSFIVTACSLL